MAGNVRWVRYELGRYVATELLLERSDRAEWAFGCYAVTELWLELGRYVATERSTRLIAA
ncbi:hypothetical protein DY000_02015190 [Brassica cretica]|uniref:Uncharacterized protein n=1 Tax=Brassica cretica TaxID=69181 RepID=A0ABQ7CNJ1_BRACR|nr:hypothetical protein DY000_02015190 [Brassica cretica]